MIAEDSVSLAARIKHALEVAIVHSGVARTSAVRLRDRVLVLAYHNVIAETAASAGDVSLHISRELFCRHLDTIEQDCTIVALTDLFLPACSARRRVAITFDDAYRGAILYALPELARRGYPSTVFVPPAFVPDATFWWDDLARCGNGLPPSCRILALSEERGRDVGVRRRWAEALTLAPPAPHDERCATLDELCAAAVKGPVTFGSHTWSHPNLAQATDSELAAELQRPLAWLRERFAGAAIPWLTYPYGISSPRVEAAAQTAGYVGAFRVDGGWLPKHPRNVFALPRFNVPAGLSPDGLALRLSGLLAR